MLKNYFQKLHRFKVHSQNGFTLIEALLGSTMMLIAVMGPLSVTMNGIKIFIENKNHIIASYLSEEIIDNLKNYRDSFAILCQNMVFDYSGDGSMIDVAMCDNNVDILEYINRSNLQTTAQLAAWKTFLHKLDMHIPDIDQPKVFNGDSGLDQNSFPTNLDSSLKLHTSCKNLYLNSDNYSCSDSGNGQKTIFERTVTLTKISDTALKVVVSVIYIKPASSFFDDKAVTVIGYIYMR